MNSSSRFAAAGALAAVFAFAFAQTTTPRTPPDPATMAQMRVDHLTRMLSLTDAQKTQALTIFTNAATAAATSQADMRTLHDALITAIKSNNTTNIDQLSTQLGALEGKLAAINAKAEAAFYAILTADQQSNYRVGFGGGRGFGGPGGPGGPGGGMGPHFRGGQRP